jgi:hypothetical protein
MERNQVIIELNDMIETYCEGCFVYQHFRKIHSQNYAQNFCMKQCTIGEKLKQYGKYLS